MGWLGTKPRTTWEMRRYLTKRFPGVSLDRVEEGVAELIRRRYLDDTAYADAYVEEARRLHPMGRNLIRLRLRERGLDEALITEALGLLTRSDEIAMAKHVAEKHRRLHLRRDQQGGNHEMDERKSQAKLMRALDQRGFSDDIARAVVFQTESQMLLDEE